MDTRQCTYPSAHSDVSSAAQSSSITDRDATSVDEDVDDQSQASINSSVSALHRARTGSYFTPNIFSTTRRSLQNYAAPNLNRSNILDSNAMSASIAAKFKVQQTFFSPSGEQEDKDQRKDRVFIWRWMKASMKGGAFVHYHERTTPLHCFQLYLLVQSACDTPSLLSQRVFENTLRSSSFFERERMGTSLLSLSVSTTKKGFFGLSVSLCLTS